MIAIRKTILVIAAAALTAACTDDLVEQGNSGRSNDGQLQFALTTVEMGRQVVATRGTATSTGTPDEGDRFTEHVLEGDNPYGLKVQRMPLPLMGFNRGAVGEPAIISQATGTKEATAPSQAPAQTAPTTRAAANEVVKTDLTNFHDSLTIWGFTDGGTTLFDQIILTKVRNWRTSVEWPYGQGTYMRFYAVTPSLESINMMASGESYATPPTLTYTLPEKSNELVDVLYGESGNVSIKSGPAGSTSTNPSQENLGKDNKRIDMQFRHILTAVRFTQGTIPKNLTIRSISIEGSRSEGTYNPAETDGDTHTAGKWTIADKAPISNFTVETNHQGKGAAGTDDVPIGGAPVLFLLPQKLPVGALLRVVIDEETTDNAGNKVHKEHKLTCDIGNQIWKKGFTVVYKITVGRLQEGYYLDAGGTIELEHSTNAVTSTTTVQSYQLSYDYSSGERVPNYAPVTWTVAGYSETGDDGSFVETKPTSLSWLTDFRGNLIGTEYEGGYNAQATLTLAAQEMKYSSGHETVLYENSHSAVGASSWNLSEKNPDGTDKGKTEPANCYIVNRTGSYNIPAVYGNMTEDNDGQLPCFKDHLGKTIKKYQIREQIGAKKSSEGTDGKMHDEVPYLWSSTTYGSLEPTLRAVLLWQDVEGLITNVTFAESSGDLIGFTVGQSKPGNAVIALQIRKVTFVGYFGATGGYTQTNIVYGDWETLWTWHIWMTDEVYQNEGKENENSFDAYYVNGSTEIEKGHYVKGNHEAVLRDETDGTEVATIMPVNLGWVPDQSAFGLYEPRSVWVKLKQTGSTNETVVQITQHARQQLYTGTGTVYQWGRPTAFPAVRNINGTERPIYDIDNKVITDKFVLAQAKSGEGYGGDAISNTYGILQWEGASNSWFDVTKSDYATANAMWNSDTKTVYDPCPPGFRVPPVEKFKGFSKTGATVKEGAGQLNMWPDGTDANGVVQKSGERLKGGYFYCKANETERYAPMVYMPATGEWHGNKSVGTELRNNTSSSSEQLNQVNGIFWTSDYANDEKNNKAAILWITPDNSYSDGTAEKPIIGFFGTDNLQDCLSSVRGLRPMKIE